MKILVIASHPDDEVLGCGGTIARHREKGDDVYLCIATKAYTPDWSEDFIKNRVKEIEKSNKILGIKRTYFLGFPTAKLDTISQKELNEAIAKIVNEVNPNIAYIPFKGDLNKDHRLLFESALVALRPINLRIKRIMSYETISETEWGQEIEVFKPNIYVDISDTFNIKISAMKEYKSELKKPPHPRSIEGIEYLARRRGMEVHVKFAEAFILIRELVL